jgi:hypothetical protein
MQDFPRASMVVEKLFTVSQHVVLILCISSLVIGCRRSGVEAKSAIPDISGDASGAHFYDTTFPQTESPISEGGRWVGGDRGGTNFWEGSFWTGGRLWGDVQTSHGTAYGVDEPTKFGDPTAVLAGTWGAAQTVTARVRINKVPTGDCCHEVELRLRTTISSKEITGYEAYCSVMPDHPYCHIARWNGPNGSYWNFETGTSATYLADGDVIQATATGTNPTVITFFKNGKEILKATDTGAAGGGFGPYGPWTSGNPGIGFFDNHNQNWEYFGFSSFSATDSIH